MVTKLLGIRYDSGHRAAMRFGVVGLMALSAVLTLPGCTRRIQVTPDSVRDVWGRGQMTTSPPPAYRERVPPGASDDDGTVIATVDGRPIARRRIVDLLMRHHGVGLLEQLIVLDAAAALAAEKGLTMSEADVDFEYQLALSRLSNPLATVTTGDMDPLAAERALEAVLAQRNISREELFITLRRNAWLRKIVNAEMKFTEEQLRAEFERTRGDRVQVRHIQVGTAAEAARLRERIAAGEDFAELARRYSANQASAAEGGLLEPFSMTDDDLPSGFREAAFALLPGEVSPAVRVGEWFHLIRQEAFIPREHVDFAAQREDLERRLRERHTEPAMFRVYEQLFTQAKIEIHDPVLREAFERRHGSR